MDTATESTTDLAEPRFADNFLQDRSIKWILASGAAILLGSSLMLVTTQWSGYAALLKETIILAYTYGIFAAGKYGYERLGLRRTGTMFLALALLLAPAACAALPWLWEAESWNIAYAALLFACGAMTARIGAVTFRHFLREPQPTLTACYATLALAGAVVPLAPLLQSPLFALFFWLVFAAGVTKGNRRLFWLLEEHRSPRILGFFPLGLLGSQFLGLFTLSYAEQTSLAWIGFGCVLTALPLAAAADAIAAVYKQRTGNAVRPLPGSILVPLIASLLLAAVGVTLAGTEIGGGKPFALIPTAALAAVLLTFVARRTERREFVYAAVALSVVAYRFVPVFFADAVRQIVQSTAAAIQEPRLPWAYYGFTFLPLLAAFSFVSVWAQRRGNLLFAVPLRRSAIGLSLAFLLLAVTHEKAMFPAALTLSFVFIGQAVAFRNRLLALPMSAALAIAAYGLPGFYNGVLATQFPDWFVVPLPASAWFVCELIVAALLFVPGNYLDRMFRRLRNSDDQPLTSTRENDALASPCRHSSLFLTGVLAASWAFFSVADRSLVPGPQLAGVVAPGSAHAWVSRKAAVSFGAVLFANLIVAVLMLQHLPSIRSFVYCETLVLLAQWLMTYLFTSRPALRVSQVFGTAVHAFAGGTLGLIFSFAVLPWHAFQTVCGYSKSDDMLWIPSVLVLGWAFDAARRGQNNILGYLAFLGVYLQVGSLVRCFGGPAFNGDQFVVLASVFVTAAIVFVEPLLQRHRERFLAWLVPLEQIVPGMTILTWGVSWLSLSHTLTFTGLVAPLVLLAYLTPRRQALSVRLPLAMLNWRLLLCVVGWTCPEINSPLQIVEQSEGMFILPVAFAAALSLMLWTLNTGRHLNASESLLAERFTELQRSLLLMVVLLMLVASLSLDSLSVMELLLAAATFAMLCGHEIYAACLTRQESRVWLALVTVGLAIAYLAKFQVIRFGHGWSMYVVLVAGLLIYGIAKLAARSHQTSILVGPFRTTALVLPAVTAGLAIYRHVYYTEMLGREVSWLGWNSLALLLAAAFYFWRGVESQAKHFTVTAAILLNVAIALLWRELRFNDPQCFMIPIGITILALVELLEREIPAANRNPLRYFGALVILVSPTFHIVDGSWLHLFSLMVAAVFVFLAGIGLRIRAMMYSGMAFLIADLVAMVVRGSIDHPQLLWIAGLGLGTSILGLGAACELQRERVQQRLRAVVVSLEAWK